MRKSRKGKRVSGCSNVAEGDQLLFYSIKYSASSGIHFFFPSSLSITSSRSSRSANTSTQYTRDIAIGRIVPGIYEAITYGAIPVIDNCTSMNNNNHYRFVRAHKGAVGFIANNFMDSEDTEAPQLNKIGIIQENLLQEWYTYSKLLAVNVLKTATNNTRDLS